MSNKIMSSKFRIIVNFVIAAILIVTDITGYWTHPEYIIEMTCISNFTIAVILILSGVRLLKGKKDFPNYVYSTALVTIMLVFMICAGSLSGMYHMNFQGAFIFLHVINPLMVLVYYMVFINEKQNGKFKFIFFTPVFSLVYLSIDYIIGSIVNKFVYGFFEPGELNLISAILVGIVLYVFLFFIGYLFFCLNKLFCKFKSADSLKRR